MVCGDILVYLGKMNFERELFYSCELAAVGEGDSLSVKAAVIRATNLM